MLKNIKNELDLKHSSAKNVTKKEKIYSHNRKKSVEGILSLAASGKLLGRMPYLPEVRIPFREIYRRIF